MAKGANGDGYSEKRPAVTVCHAERSGQAESYEHLGGETIMLNSGESISKFLITHQQKQHPTKTVTVRLSQGDMH